MFYIYFQNSNTVAKPQWLPMQNIIWKNDLAYQNGSFGSLDDDESVVVDDRWGRSIGDDDVICKNIMKMVLTRAIHIVPMTARLKSWGTPC